MRVAVLGAGIMGSATALLLARRGIHVTLFDKADQPFAGASRWNEGKIHLGYLYSADPSLSTARRIIPGGLAFKRLTEELIGRSLDPAVCDHDDTYVVHRHSVVSADDTGRYLDAVSALVRECGTSADYLTPVSGARSTRLSRRELSARYNPEHIVAAFRVPERSVSTCWLADRFVEALSAEPGIEQRMGTSVTAVRRSGDSHDAPLIVVTDVRDDGPFDRVVNALWEGRLAIDATLGLPCPSRWSHRFRLSAFVRASDTIDIDSAVVATGPFGDIKNYNGRDLYLSWYLTGLRVEGSAISPPMVPTCDDAERGRILDEICNRLTEVIPDVATVRARIEDVRVAGGWVYAAGDGSLADPTSTLHRRDHVGISRVGSYVSVDTGKYSIAPWLAQEVARTLA